MKLINYNYGGPQEFNCWIRGKIIVSRNEWRQIQLYLFNPAVLAKLGRTHGVGFVGRMLREDMERKVKTSRGYLVNIRTSATHAVIAHFHPQNYRRYKLQNYMFEVIN